MSELVNLPGPEHIVGIGASAGGVEAFQLLIQKFRMDSTAFVFILHFPPDAPSYLPEILQRRTKLRVERIESGVRVQPNVVYAMAPGCDIALRDGVLILRPFAGPRWKTIDRFFSTLAEEQGGRAVGVVLSGAGNDGVAGLEAIRRAGGLTCVQRPETARFKSMPEQAAAVAELCLEPEALGVEIMKRLGIEPLEAP
jgi:two-component system CheB/CheR fusion protein